MDSSTKHYPLQLESLPRLECTNPSIDEHTSAGVCTKLMSSFRLYVEHYGAEITIVICFQKPLVILNSDLVSSASAWDLDYFEAKMSGKYTVIVSDDHKFMYYDNSKREACPDFIPSTKRVQMTMPDFASRIRNAKANVDERVYLQQSLMTASVGLGIIHDFAHFNWKWIKEQQRQNEWGPLTNNLLMISMGGETFILA